VERLQAQSSTAVMIQSRRFSEGETEPRHDRRRIISLV
jgi:hypothetical protein